MVMSVTFGATNIVNLYVNPASLDGSAPGTPSATYSTTNSLAFQSLSYYGGDGTGQSSLDELRVGTSFAAVTPATPVVIPAAPTSLTAAPGNASAALSWSAVSGATSYNVYQGTASGAESATPIATGVTGNSYTAIGLTNGTTYYFTVAAVNPAGIGAVSNEASATPSVAAGIPAVPTLTAAAGDLQATLNWSTSAGATSYNVYQGATSGAEGSTPIATGITATTYTVTGLTNEVTYFFKVSATNTSGTSALSNEATATPAPPVGGTNSPASFSIFPQVVAAHPVNAGFNMQPAPGANITENDWLVDGGFNSNDERIGLTADTAGSATTFIDQNAGGGTSFYQSVASGFYNGANARTYRFVNGAWTLLRTDTVLQYNAPQGSTTPTAANSTVTFASSGPPTQVGDIIWIDLDNQPFVPQYSQMNTRLDAYSYCPTWGFINSSGGQTGCESATTGAWPITLSSNVPPSDTGGLSALITAPSAGSAGIWQYIQGAFVGPAYEQFQPGHTYQYDVWLMAGSGVSGGNVTVQINGLSGTSHTFTGVNGTWQEFTYSFPAPAGLPANSSAPWVELSYTASATGATLYVDNFQLYDTAWAPNTVSPQAMAAWQAYKPGTVRIWSNFGNNSQNYSYWSLNSWLTPEIKTRNTFGVGNVYELTGELEHLPDALANVKTIGTANPWLIVNMALSEVEWGELIDYLAAPTGTGYASMRPANHPGPYTADFSAIYLEVGNEEWGTQQVPADTEYGQWANFVISNATAGKTYPGLGNLKFIVDGFDLLPSFGSAAQAAAPQASVVDAALYTQGNQTLSGDAYYQSDLVQVPVSNGPIINSIVSQQQLDAASGRVYSLAAYEEGPGQDTTAYPGDPSLAAGIGAVDVNLYASQSGFGPQNIYLYQLGTGPYSTTTNFANGYRPHPVWEALQMRNNYTSGPIVLTNTNSVPTYSDPTITNGQPVPLIAVYTFADANVANQADVVVISRDLNNNTPVTLNFPATPTGTAQLYTLTGDPRANNDEALNIPIGSQSLTGVTASYTFTMPPGSMYIFQVPMTGAWSSNGQPTPPPPASLGASAGNGEVTLTWPASSGATGYNVLRGNTTGGPYTQIGTSTSVAYTDTAVTNGNTYYYVVQATNGGGASNNSPEASATPNVEDGAETTTPPPLTGADTGAWANAPFIPLTHYFSDQAGTNGSPDTAAYKILWDSNYLYVLVSVQDQYLIAPTQANIYDGETVEMYFSGTDTRSTTYGATDFQYAFPYGSGGAVVTETYHSPASLTGVIFGQQNITGGYQMAMALPWTTLGTTPVLNQQYGFDVMIDTANTQGNKIGKIGWWATCDCDWDNPSNFGPLVLTQPSTQPQTITFTQPASPVTYGVTPITLSATGGASGNPVTFSLDSSSTPGAATLSGTNNSILTITGAGTVVVDANQAAGAGYAAAAPVSRNIIVNPATLTVTANNVNITLGAAIPAFTASYSGFENGDGAGVLSGAPSLTTTATSSSPAGTYPIVAALGTLSSPNYTFSFVNGTLSIVQSPTVIITTTAVIGGSHTGGYTATITVKNTGTGTASNVTLTAATLGSATGTPLPQGPVNVAPGASTVFLVSYPGSVGLDNSAVSEKYSGTYTGGSFAASVRSVTLP
jgi:fibronectin type 3 domain-containing protein